MERIPLNQTGADDVESNHDSCDKASFGGGTSKFDLLAANLKD
jgi:hypothetical protein